LHPIDVIAIPPKVHPHVAARSNPSPQALE
jgi:hypothetical protein